MAKYKPNMWRENTWDHNGEPVSQPEPWAYQMEPDPLHQTDFEVGRDSMLPFIKEATACYKAWLLDHSRNLDAMLKTLLQRWLKKGGKADQWETINKSAINQSGYAKAISKEAKEMIAYQTRPKEITKPKAKPFNGLDISSIRL